MPVSLALPKKNLWYQNEHSVIILLFLESCLINKLHFSETQATTYWFRERQQLCSKLVWCWIQLKQASTSRDILGQLPPIGRRPLHQEMTNLSPRSCPVKKHCSIRTLCCHPPLFWGLEHIPWKLHKFECLIFSSFFLPGAKCTSSPETQHIAVLDPQ